MAEEYRYLTQIQSPQDLRRLPKEKLPELAAECRRYLIETISRVGGHFASSLGATELSIAVHYVFDTPNDRIVWDTGHQGYVHKMLTGRREALGSVRQLGGISGFLRREESEYDTFGAGHASTSISAALGMAAARDLRGEERKVVAIVSDGAVTGGMAFEALMNAGHLATDLLVILNDNQIFISHRVGALGAYLTKVLTFGLLQKFERRLKRFLQRMRFWGRWLVRIAQRFRVLLFPGMLFEEMGFAYLGPVDGHDVIRLVEVLQHVKELKGPVLLHVVTKKGKGYGPAEKDPIKYHGVTRFDPRTGEFSPAAAGPPAYTKVFGQTLLHLAKRDPRVVGITAAMPEGTGLDLLRKELPERFFDVGLAEQHAVTFAAGLACEGMRPVAAIYSTFLQRGFDQCLHDVGLQKLNVVFALDRGGLVGEDGPTHHGVFDFAYLRIIPNFVVMAPADENELRHMLYTALAYEDGPIALRYPRGAGEGVPMDADLRRLPIGKGEILREGSDLWLVGIGSLVHPCLQAATILEKEGISAGVVNARFVKPLDEDLLRMVGRRSGLLVTAEDHVLAGGFGSAVQEALEGDPIRIVRIGIPDRFVEHGKPNLLRESLGLTPEGIAATCRKALSRYERVSFPAASVSS